MVVAEEAGSISLATADGTGEFALSSWCFSDRVVPELFLAEDDRCSTLVPL